MKEKVWMPKEKVKLDPGQFCDIIGERQQEGAEEAYIDGFQAGCAYQAGGQKKATEMSVELLQKSAGYALAGAIMIGAMTLWSKFKEYKASKEKEPEVVDTDGKPI